MTHSNTAVLLQGKKKKTNNLPATRQPTPIQRALSKRVMDEYKCALLKPKTQ